MAAHEHLAAAQFKRREGRPNKRVHSASDEEDNSSAPGKPHVHVHKATPPAKHHRGH